MCKVALTILSLPTELLMHIFSDDTLRQTDCHSLLLSCSRLHAVILPRLYTRPHASTYHGSLRLYETLRGRPEFCTYVAHMEADYLHYYPGLSFDKWSQLDGVSDVLIPVLPNCTSLSLWLTGGFVTMSFETALEWASRCLKLSHLELHDLTLVTSNIRPLSDIRGTKFEPPSSLNSLHLVEPMFGGDASRQIWTMCQFWLRTLTVSHMTGLPSPSVLNGISVLAPWLQELNVIGYTHIASNNEVQQLLNLDTLTFPLAGQIFGETFAEMKQLTIDIYGENDRILINHLLQMLENGKLPMLAGLTVRFHWRGRNSDVRRSEIRLNLLQALRAGGSQAELNTLDV